MDVLTDAEVAELGRFAKELSKPGMPVSIDYEPPSPYVGVNCNRPGQNKAGRGLVLSGYATLEQLKAAIKSQVGG